MITATTFHVKPEALDHRPETPNPEPKTPDPKPKTLTPIPEPRNSKAPNPQSQQRAAVIVANKMDLEGADIGYKILEQVWGLGFRV